MTNEVAVDWEFEQQAVESQLSRPAVVTATFQLILGKPVAP